MAKCPNCGSVNTVWLTTRSVLIAIDDAVDYSEFFCENCEYNWEE